MGGHHVFGLVDTRLVLVLLSCQKLPECSVENNYFDCKFLKLNANSILLYPNDAYCSFIIGDQAIIQRKKLRWCPKVRITFAGIRFLRKTFST